MARASSMILAAILLTWWPDATEANDACQVNGTCEAAEGQSILQVKSMRGQVAVREVAAEESEQVTSQGGQVAASSSSATGISDEVSGCPSVLVVSKSNGWMHSAHRAMLGVYATDPLNTEYNYRGGSRPVYKSVRSSTEIHFVGDDTSGDWYIGNEHGYAWKSRGSGTLSCPTDVTEWNTWDGRTDVSQFDRYLTVEAQGPIPSGLWFTAVSFPCTWSDGCVRTPNYLQGLNVRTCSIDINPAESISIELDPIQIDVEGSHTRTGGTVLTVNGFDYEGTHRWASATVVPTESIQWSAYSYASTDGWELCPVRTGCTSSRHTNAAISGHNREHLTGIDPDGCTRACCSRSWCQTFDYYKNTRRCDLSDQTASDVGGLKRDYAGNPYDHYVVRQ